MAGSSFTFLKEEFPKIYRKCVEMEDNIFKGKYETALMLGRQIGELTSKEICAMENLQRIFNLDQFSRLEEMEEYNLIDYDTQNYYQRIRKLGNDAVHQNAIVTKDDAYQMHRLVYYVTSNFYKNFTQSETPKKVSTYQGLFESETYDLMKEDMAKQDNTTKVKVNEEVKSVSGVNTVEPSSISSDEDVNTEPIVSKDNVNLDTDNYEAKVPPILDIEPIKSSYLVAELSKLKDSSREAVEGYEGLSSFKNYLHIKRSIQEELESKLNEVVNDDEQKLVILCGSVGDGKSHLLAYLNSTQPELMGKFKIKNDATESNDPNKTSIDTLADFLTSFDDTHISNNKEKCILSINLGVLNNFIESDYADDRYTKLKDILNDLNIFNSDDFSEKFEEDFVSIISFSDYNLFEFTDDPSKRVKSDYIISLIEKVTNPIIENPFYQAYLKDKENKINSPVIYNYEMLSDRDVQETIVDLIIKVMIQYKKIISTRELFNFIYEIIVPPNLKEYDNSYLVLDYKEQLLPNLLFQSKQSCDILRIINLEDPITKRSELIDQLLINLNIQPNIRTVLNKFMDCSRCEFLIKDLDSVNINNIKGQETINTIIRFLNIFGNEEVKVTFTKPSYLTFLNNLYFYNQNDFYSLKILIYSVKKALFKWKGELKKDYICLDRLNKFQVAKSLKVHYVKPNLNNSKNMDINSNRFKTSIKLNFYVDDELDKIIQLNVDYELFELIIKLTKGFRPNNIEQKNLLLFQDFINKLISVEDTKEYLIYNIDDDKYFNFELDEFDYYSFSLKE